MYALSEWPEGYFNIKSIFSGIKIPIIKIIGSYIYILIFKTGQPGCQLNLSEGQIRLDLKDKLGWIWRADDP